MVYELVGCLWLRGLPLWLSWWRICLQCRRPGSIPGLGKSPGEGKGYPLQYSGLENSMDCIVYRVPNSQTRLGDVHFHCYSGSFCEDQGCGSIWRLDGRRSIPRLTRMIAGGITFLWPVALRASVLCWLWARSLLCCPYRPLHRASRSVAAGLLGANKPEKRLRHLLPAFQARCPPPPGVQRLKTSERPKPSLHTLPQLGAV